MSLSTTFYFEFGYEYKDYRIRIQNGYFEFGFAFEYLLNHILFLMHPLLELIYSFEKDLHKSCQLTFIKNHIISS
jgi:hypothetical protein